MKAVSRSAAGRRGRHIATLHDDGSVVVRLKLYLRTCVGPRTLAEVSISTECSTAALSKALNGTTVPSRRLVLHVAALTDSKTAVAKAISLWKIAVLESIGLTPMDLAFPDPKDVADFSTVLRGYLLTTDRLLGLTEGKTPSAHHVVVASKHLRDARPLSLSTVTRLLGGKTAPTFETLNTFLRVVKPDAVASARLEEVLGEFVRRGRRGEHQAVAS